MYSRNWYHDRRRFKRLNLNLVIWYKVVGNKYVSLNPQEKDVEATTVDLSPFGLSFVTCKELPIYSKLVIKFIVFKATEKEQSNLAIPLEVKAEVRSCLISDNNEYRVGVSFKGIEIQEQMQLVNLIRESLKPCLQI